MISEIRNHVRQDESFAFETTLSGRHYAQLIPQWQSAGYSVKLFFLKLASPELAIARVQQRVKEGGHNIPELVIRRRFSAGFQNFENLYKSLVDEWALYDNSASVPILIKVRSESMSTKSNHSSATTRQRDPDFVKAEAVMKRASLKARERAMKFGIGVVVQKEGQIVEECSDGNILSVSS